MLMATSPSIRSEDNTLAKEIANAPPLLQTSNSYTGSTGVQNDNELTEMTVEQTATAAALAAAAAAAASAPSDENSNEEPVASAAGSESDEGIEDDPLLSTTATEGGASCYPMLPSASDDGTGIKVSGTLRLRSRDPLEDYRDRDRLDHVQVGCFPNCVLSVWGSLFD